MPVRRGPVKSRMRSRKRAPVGRYGNQSVRLRGQGGYFADAWGNIKKGAGYLSRAVPAGTFSAMGRNLGAAGAVSYGRPDLAPLGSYVGGKAGQALSSLVGFGAYDVKANTLVPVSDGQPIPHFGNLEAATIVSHREFIGDITADGGTAFTNASYPINPGLASTFPWLSGVSRGYSQYRFLGLVFEFRSTASDITAGGALGSVIMGTEYDVSDAVWTDKTTMQNAQYSLSDRPSNNIWHPVECDPRLSPLDTYDIRNSDIPTGKDGRFYDLGNFQIATVGLPTSSGNLGELWVSYEVALFKPILAPAGGLTADFALPTTVSATHYLGADTSTVNSPSAHSTLGCYTVNSTLYFPANMNTGNYLITYAVVGSTSTLTTAVAMNSLTNCSSCNIYNGNTGGFVNVEAGASSNTQLLVRAVTITASPASVTITAGTLPGSISYANLTVTELASALP